jgi:hypothetical protein
MMAHIQMILFMKNVRMFDGALLITQFGAGPLVWMPFARAERA